MRELTDLQSFNLCEASYQENFYNINKQFMLQDSKMIVLAVVSESARSGLHAFAVAKLEDYQMWKKHNLFGHRLRSIYYVIRGTANSLDFQQDWRLKDPPNDKTFNQFTDFSIFLTKVKQIYQPRYQQFIGHSLGGAIAQYGSINEHADAKTFAAAKCWAQLEKYQQNKITKFEAYNKIRNYVHFDDYVSDLPLDLPKLGKNFVVGQNDFNPEHAFYNRMGVKGHFLETFAGEFNERGQINIIEKVTPKTDLPAKQLDEEILSAENQYIALMKFIKSNLPYKKNTKSS